MTASALPGGAPILSLDNRLPLRYYSPLYGARAFTIATPPAISTPLSASSQDADPERSRRDSLIPNPSRSRNFGIRDPNPCPLPFSLFLRQKSKISPLVNNFG